MESRVAKYTVFITQWKGQFKCSLKEWKITDDYSKKTDLTETEK